MRMKLIYQLILQFWVPVLSIFSLMGMIGYSYYIYSIRAQGACFSPESLQTDSRCLYRFSEDVYEKGTRTAPHMGHACGTDVTDFIPVTHLASITFYLDPNYKGEICAAPTPTAVPTATPTAVPTATIVPPSPTPTVSQSSPTNTPVPTTATNTPSPSPTTTASAAIHTPTPSRAPTAVATLTPTPTQTVMNNSGITGGILDSVDDLRAEFDGLPLGSSGDLWAKVIVPMSIDLQAENQIPIYLASWDAPAGIVEMVLSFDEALPFDKAEFLLSSDFSGWEIVSQSLIDERKEVLVNLQAHDAQDYYQGVGLVLGTLQFSLKNDLQVGTQISVHSGYSQVSVYRGSLAEYVRVQPSDGVWTIRSTHPTAVQQPVIAHSDSQKQSEVLRLGSVFLVYGMLGLVVGVLLLWVAHLVRKIVKKKETIR